MTLFPKNVMKLARGSLNNIFQDSFNKILSQKLTSEQILYIFNAIQKFI